MKKILFASTALVASAGFAAADIEFSGEAIMGFGFVDDRVVVTGPGADGIPGNADDTTAPGDDWVLLHEATLSVAMSGETDVGLAFGADFDITGSAGGIDNEVVYIEGGFGKLEFGDVDNAVQAVTGLADLGLDGLGTDDIAEDLRNDSAADMLYTGNFNGFEVALSHLFNGDDWGIGVKFAPGDYTVALAYDEAAGTNAVHLQAGANVADFALAALFSTTVGDPDPELTSYGITAGYSFGAVDVMAAYSRAEDGVADTDVEGFGIDVTYDLGGGAKFKAGVAEVGEQARADFGISMTF